MRLFGFFLLKTHFHDRTWLYLMWEYCALGAGQVDRRVWPRVVSGGAAVVNSQSPANTGTRGAEQSADTDRDNNKDHNSGHPVSRPDSESNQSREWWTVQRWADLKWVGYKRRQQVVEWSTGWRRVAPGIQWQLEVIRAPGDDGVIEAVTMISELTPVTRMEWVPVTCEIRKQTQQSQLSQPSAPGSMAEPGTPATNRNTNHDKKVSWVSEPHSEQNFNYYPFPTHHNDHFSLHVVQS